MSKRPQKKSVTTKSKAAKAEEPLRLPAAAQLDAAALSDRARLLWLAGDWVSLTAIAGQQAESIEGQPHLALLLASGFLQLGEMQEAREWIARARKWGADDTALTRMLVSGTYNSLGRGFYLLGQTARAEAQFETAVTMGHAGTAIPQLAALRAEEQKSQLDRRRAGDQAARAARQGERLFAAENWKGAREAFAKAIDLAPDEARYHQWLGETEARIGRWNPAVNAYREALKRDPNVGVSFYRTLPVKIAKPGPYYVENPIFVIGCGHSGTSIMIALLGNHPNIYAVPGESGLFRKTDDCALEMMEQWDNTSHTNGRLRWVEKTPPNIFQIGRFLRMRPAARFLLMLRDGRDVVCSLKFRTGFEKFETRLDRWIYDNMAGLPWWDHPQVRVVRYEDLVAEPQETLRSTCEFLGEEYSEQMLTAQFGKHDHWYSDRIEKPDHIINLDDHNNLRNWQVNQPLFDGRGRWKEEMSRIDQDKFKNNVKGLSFADRYV